MVAIINAGFWSELIFFCGRCVGHLMSLGFDPLVSRFEFSSVDCLRSRGAWVPLLRGERLSGVVDGGKPCHPGMEGVADHLRRGRYDPSQYWTPFASVNRVSRIGNARLSHRVASGLMVSNPFIEQEGWELVDKLGEEACDPSVVDARRSSLPPTIHFCQVTLSWNPCR